VLTENGNKGIFLDEGNSYAMIQNNNCNDNLDASFDIYIATPPASFSLLLANNFGRIYQHPNKKQMHKQQKKYEIFSRR
jgi:hypothetical protein